MIFIGQDNLRGVKIVYLKCNHCGYKTIHNIPKPIPEIPCPKCKKAQ